jgi:type II secretory ATPase GspE/PulE/Tfp pilus assembly ATPase PilB-like protein
MRGGRARFARPTWALHTNSTAETVVRLLDMGLDPFNFADALLGVLAQRLVKRICEACREPYRPARAEYEELARAYGEPAFAEGGPTRSSGSSRARPPSWTSSRW